MFNFTFFTNTNYSFEGKKEGEEVVLFLHRHWFTIISKIVTLLAATFLPLIVILFLGPLLLKFNFLTLFAVACAGYYLLLWFVLFYFLTMYTLDVWIVTNMRIIDSKQHGFFNRNVAELSLGNIQDVAYNLEGAVSTMINYGNVEVQTAGHDTHFMFEQIPNPEHVKDVIMKISTEYKNKQLHQTSSI